MFHNLKMEAKPASKGNVLKKKFQEKENVSVCHTPPSQPCSVEPYW